MSLAASTSSPHPRRSPFPLGSPFFAALLLASLCFVSGARAETLASKMLPMPLAPGMPHSTSIPLPASFSPEKPTWVAYQVFAVSASDQPSGEIMVSGMFEGEPTPPRASNALFVAGDLMVSISGGTVDEQFESSFGTLDEDELRGFWGDEMYEAYVAVNAGSGRILQGIIHRELPPLQHGEPTLLVSVERAQGIQPTGLMVSVGQGAIPAHLQVNVESTTAFKLGLGLGRMTFFLLLIGVGYVAYRFVLARRHNN